MLELFDGGARIQILMTTLPLIRVVFFASKHYFVVVHTNMIIIYVFHAQGCLTIQSTLLHQVRL